MRAERRPDGRLLVPCRVVAEDGTIGDSTMIIGPEHPNYAAWLATLEDEPADAAER